MRLMGIEAIYRKKRTSIPGKGHKIYPYLLGGVSIERPNQVVGHRHHLCADGPGLCLPGGDRGSLQPQGARLPGEQRPELDFCVEALQEALARYGPPEIFNTDQGSQFTAEEFTAVLLAKGVRVSMDGKGRWVDNVFVERLWRSVKYEQIYLHAHETIRELKVALTSYFGFFNARRPHQSLKYRTPDEVYFGTAELKKAA